MTQKKMEKLINQIFKEIQTTREAGQKEYARKNDNAFANFEREMKKYIIVLLIIFGCESNNPMEPLESNDHETIRPVPCCVYPIINEHE